VILGVIPARGGSKGIPRKNVKSLCGKPLIAWSIEAAKKSKLLDRFVVSTEDEEITKVARKYGAEVIHRSPELAKDETLILAVLQDVLKKIDAKIVLKNALHYTVGKKYDLCFSSGLIEHFEGVQRQQIVAKHLELAKWVFITQPNPANTVYKARRLLGGLKKYPAENPLTQHEVEMFGLGLECKYIRRAFYPNYSMLIKNKFAGVRL
jgi:hypothetical protein